MYSYISVQTVLDAPYRSHLHIYEWNSVNVVVDGQLQHGYFVNIGSDGLIVDFRRASQEPVFVEFGRIFECSAAAGFWDGDPPWKRSLPCASSYGNGNPEKPVPGDPPLQALMRFHPDHPLTWYPAKLLEYEFPGRQRSECLLVELTVNDHIVRTVLPSYRVRLTPSADDMDKLRLSHNHFIIRSTSLPLDDNADLVCLYSHILRLRFRAAVISAANGRLLYFTRKFPRTISSEEIEELFLRLKADFARYGKAVINKAWNQNDVRPITRALTTPSSASADERGIPLPVELLVEVFQCLDTLKRQLLRRTCFLWNSILTSRQLYQDIVVSLFGDHGRDFVDFLNCLVLCCTTRTRRVCITGARPYFRNPSVVLESIIKFTAVREVILSNCTFREFVGVLPAASDGYRKVAAAGIDRIVWRNCYYTGENQVVLARIPYAVVYPQRVEPAELWDTVEINLVWGRLLSAGQESVADHLAESIKQNGSAWNGPLWILNWFQSCDPRPATHYRQLEWTRDNIRDLDVKKLSPITIRMLLNNPFKHSPRHR